MGWTISMFTPFRLTVNVTCDSSVTFHHIYSILEPKLLLVMVLEFDLCLIIRAVFLNSHKVLIMCSVLQFVKEILTDVIFNKSTSVIITSTSKNLNAQMPFVIAAGSTNKDN